MKAIVAFRLAGAKGLEAAISWPHARSRRRMHRTASAISTSGSRARTATRVDRKRPATSAAEPVAHDRRHPRAGRFGRPLRAAPRFDDAPVARAAFVVATSFVTY